MGKIDIKKKLKEKALFQSAFDLFRSEERRVGKEC